MARVPGDRSHQPRDLGEEDGRANGECRDPEQR
jgi:hypothetical protein